LVLGVSPYLPATHEDVIFCLERRITLNEIREAEIDAGGMNQSPFENILEIGPDEPPNPVAHELTAPTSEQLEHGQSELVVGLENFSNPADLEVKLQEIEAQHIKAGRLDSEALTKARLAVVVGIKQFNNSRFKLVDALLEYRAELKANRGWMEVLKAIAVAINVTDRTVRNLISEYEEVTAILPTVVIEKADSRGIDLCQTRYLLAVKTREGTIKPDDVVSDDQAGQIVDSIIAFKMADKVAKSPRPVPNIEDFADRIAISLEKLLTEYSPEVREAEVRYVLEYLNAKLRTTIRDIRQYGRPMLVPKPATMKEEVA
jgi:hypothetical protein